MVKYKRRLLNVILASLRRASVVALGTLVVTIVVVSTDPLPATSASTKSTTTSSTSTTTSTVPPPSTNGLIAAGPSRSECVDPDFPDTGLAAINSAVAKFDAVTGSSVTCLSAYLTSEPTWWQWEHPWITAPQYGYTRWVAQKSRIRQLVLQVNLIPDSLKNVKNPLRWEQSCAAGDFNSYATELGVSLVAAGLQNSVLRLGAEMNGIWEADFIGYTSQEQKLWTLCFANEVTGLRQATGEHFLIDWNANACVENIPFANFYPGNAFVDIVGLDLFDVSCTLPKTRLSFKQLASERLGLTDFEAFALARGKPMSFPEWGLKAFPSGDDPGYIDGIGANFTRRDFAFETYFNVNVRIRPYLALGPSAPSSLKAFKVWFGARPQK